MSIIPENLFSISPYIRLAWDFKSPVNWGLPERVIFDHELIYIKEGEGTFTIGGVEYSARPGDIFFLKPGIPHTLRADAGKYLHKPHVHFDFFERPDSDLVYICKKHFDAIPEEERCFFRDDITSTPNFYLPDKIQLNNHWIIEGMLMKLIDEHNRKEHLFELYERTLLIEIFVTLFRRMKVERNQAISVNSRGLEAARRYIQEHYDKTISLDDAAHAASLSPFYFNRLFVQMYGIPPMKYHKMARIEKAKQMIEYSSLSVTEIADQLGFSSIHLFSRVFKQVVGISPTDYMMIEHRIK